ncbi:MAG: PASTA domain-containing protein [Deltaproteobacteria bacterium]|nr:PASTA domain-containing protein [Deltaproteobacteria bacterium]
MYNADQRRFGRRVNLLRFLFVVLILFVFARSAQLQIGQHHELDRLARSQYLDDIQLPARRGQIYDRNGEPLAIAIDVPSVYANPAKVVDARAAARDLAPILKLSRETIYHKLIGDRLFVWLKRQVDPEIAVKVQSLNIDGINITKESRRFYPHRELGSQLIGFTNIDVRGLEGIEKAFDEVLTGEPQVVGTERDGRGRTVLKGGLDLEQRTRGADVFLTIDVQIQHAVETALANAVKTTRARSAMGVVLDVASGDILASGVWPKFNPNLGSKAPAYTRRNRVITDMFEPGSTLKPVVIAGALESGTVKPNAVIFCENGSYTIYDRTIRDSKPHGWLSLTGVMQKSSNICAAKIGAAMGRQKLSQWLFNFGFGNRTGISFPGESTGLMRDPSKWADVGLATISFGHGIAVTAIQLAAAYRVLAAGGMYRSPRLVKYVRSAEGEHIDVPLALERQIISRKTTEYIRDMLEAAVKPEGTGVLASVPGYRVAGKTGTAQKPDFVAGGYTSDTFIAVFSGYLPANEPRVVIIVAIDEPKTHHTGGSVAAPAFSEIGATAMRVLGVSPSQPTKTPAVALANVVENENILQVTTPSLEVVNTPGTVPSFIGLTARQAVRRYAAANTGLDLDLLGTGIVVRQEPTAGTKNTNVDRLTLMMAQLTEQGR